MHPNADEYKIQFDFYKRQQEKNKIEQTKAKQMNFGVEKHLLGVTKTMV